MGDGNAIDQYEAVGRLTTCVVRMEERGHEQPLGIHSCSVGGKQRDDIAAAFRYWLFDRKRRGYGRLVVSLRLVHRQLSEVAVRLIQMSMFIDMDLSFIHSALKALFDQRLTLAVQAGLGFFFRFAAALDRSAQSGPQDYRDRRQWRPRPAEDC